MGRQQKQTSRHPKAAPSKTVHEGSTWKKIKKLLGFGPNCKNGGTKTLRGECECPRYFVGAQCETIQCMNNGTIRYDKQSCQCMHEQYISGRHCERIRCANGGDSPSIEELQLLQSMGKTASCRCLTNWYHGRFCEHYSSPWAYFIAVPVLLLLLFVAVCVISQLPICKRRRGRRRRAPRNRPVGEPESDRCLPSAPPVPPSTLPPPGVNPRLAMHQQQLHSNPTVAVRPPSMVIDPPPYAKPTADAVPPAYDEVVNNLERFPSQNPHSTTNTDDAVAQTAPPPPLTPPPVGD